MKKKFTQIIYTIILSIIAAALWEKLLSNIFDKIVTYIFSFGNKFIKWISNITYSRIAEGVYINVSYYIFIIIVSCILSVFIIMFRYPPFINKDKTTNEHDSISKKGIMLLKSVICIIYFFFLLFLLATNFINDNITKATNNIEIVSPYLSEQEYKMLKSKFHTINSKDDFDDLYSILKDYSDKYGVTLRE